MVAFDVQTNNPVEMIDITARVAEAVRAAGLREGACVVYVPHTTAGVTINENADPDVARDLLAALDRIVPLRGPYRHREGNAAAHVKASLCGASATVFVREGALALGTWQSLFFCEFDGPRRRHLWVEILPRG